MDDEEPAGTGWLDPAAKGLRGAIGRPFGAVLGELIARLGRPRGASGLFVIGHAPIIPMPERPVRFHGLRQPAGRLKLDADGRVSRPQ
jgi:hypothetical protein